jgi:hypothetical protein
LIVFQRNRVGTGIFRPSTPWVENTGSNMAVLTRVEGEKEGKDAEGPSDALKSEYVCAITWQLK